DACIALVDSDRRRLAMKPTFLVLLLATCFALAVTFLTTSVTLANSGVDKMTTDAKVTEIIMDLKSLYEMLAKKVPANAVIQAGDFDRTFGPHIAASLMHKNAQRIERHGGFFVISLANKDVESGQYLATTLDKVVSFYAAGPADNFTMWEITGVSVKPKAIP